MGGPGGGIGGSVLDPVGIFGGGQTDRGGIGGFYDDTFGELLGTNAAAEAAQRAAQERREDLKRARGIAETGLEDVKGLRRNINARVSQSDSLAMSGFRDILNRAESPQELRALQQSLAQQEKAINKQAELFASIDPAILEASQQALQLLRGEEAKTLKPLKDERARQRQALTDRLREQLGPGAETSTAGIQALNDFDQETSLILNQSQQQALNQVSSLAGAGAQARSSLNQGIGQLGQIGQAFGDRAGRMSNTALGANQFLQGVRQAGTGNQLAVGQQVQQGFANLTNAQTGLAASAGANQVAQQLQAQAQNQFLSDRIQAGEQMAASTGGQAAGGAGCCFIFLEARYGDGTMDKVVRMYRDEHMTLRNKRGYYKLSEVLVPLMRKSKLIKFLVRFTMTDPLVSYGRYHYGENKWGYALKPVKNFWLSLFNYLGQDHEYVRENGEVV